MIDNTSFSYTIFNRSSEIKEEEIYYDLKSLNNKTLSCDCSIKTMQNYQDYELYFKMIKIEKNRLKTIVSFYRGKFDVVKNVENYFDDYDFNNLYEFFYYLKHNRHEIVKDFMELYNFENQKIELSKLIGSEYEAK